MADVKLRQAIALEAARLMYERLESEYYTAKRKAAKRLCRRGVKPEDLPSNAEIRDQIQVFARIHEGDKRIAAQILTRDARQTTSLGPVEVVESNALSPEDCRCARDRCQAVICTLEDCWVPA